MASKVIKSLHDTGKAYGWKETPLNFVKKLVEANPEELIRRNGPRNEIPIVYAVSYKANKIVISYLLEVMVDKWGYSSSYRDSIKAGMITNLYDMDAANWRKTTLTHVQDLVGDNRGILDEWGGVHDDTPIYYALWGEARVKVVAWMCEMVGVDAVSSWRDEYGWTYLHYCAKWNRPKHIPYFLYLMGPAAVNIRNDTGKIAIEYAEIKNNEELAHLLANPNECIAEYAHSFVKEDHYSVHV